MNRKKRALAAFSFTGVAAASIACVVLGSGCELIVHLDRSLADANTEDVVLGVCPICTPLEDGGMDAGDATMTGDADAGSSVDAEAGED